MGVGRGGLFDMPVKIGRSVCGGVIEMIEILMETHWGGAGGEARVVGERVGWSVGCVGSVWGCFGVW